MGGTDVGQFLTTICLYIRCIIVVVSGYCSYGRGLDNGLEIGVLMIVLPSLSHCIQLLRPNYCYFCSLSEGYIRVDFLVLTHR